MLLYWLTTILRKQTVLQTDASINGLSAYLLQDEKPVYFACRALTEAQQGYVAIELESLAVAWVMDKFPYFLFASHFILETDQMPLEAILSKSLNHPTPRLQRILIRTFPYHFTMQYIPGLNNQLAIACPIQVVKRTLSISSSCILTRIQFNCVPEATAYNKLELLHKKMMSLCCSSIPSHKDGQAISKKFPVLYSLIGH